MHQQFQTLHSTWYHLSKKFKIGTPKSNNLYKAKLVDTQTLFLHAENYNARSYNNFHLNFMQFTTR